MFLSLSQVKSSDKKIYNTLLFHECTKGGQTMAKQELEFFDVKTKDKFKATVNYAYGASANQIQMLNGQVLHQQNYTGSGKIIAVLEIDNNRVRLHIPLLHNFVNNIFL